jgi:hypothetical protein
MGSKFKGYKKALTIWVVRPRNRLKRTKTRKYACALLQVDICYKKKLGFHTENQFIKNINMFKKSYIVDVYRTNKFA